MYRTIIASALTLFLVCFSFITGVRGVDPPYNVPDCPETHVSLLVPENTNKTAVIVSSFNCTDADTGPEGTLKYRMKVGNQRKLSVDEDTGALSIIRRLNADRTRYYNVEIEVYDQGEPSLTTTIVVDIDVSSVNDNAPKLQNLPTEVIIDEDTPFGTEIASCTLKDADSGYGGLAGEVRLKTVSTNDLYGKFTMDVVRCKIYVHRKLVYHNQNRFDYQFRAVDLDPVIPKSSNIHSLTILIVDGNNRAPTCENYLELAEVAESTSTGTELTRLSCSDLDAGVYGQLTYTAAGGDTDMLLVDSDSGAITLKSTLDYESGRVELVLDVEVNDGGNGLRFTVTTQVIVTVTNVDDEDINFTPDSVFSTVISEDTPPGTVILTTYGEDPDLVNDTTNQFQFGFEVPPDPAWFTIDPGTGSVVVTSLLDRETQNRSHFDIKVFSNNAPGIKAVATVTIDITDVNDVAPVFTKRVFTALLPEHSKSGATVTSVEAQDPDEGPGGEIEYSIDDALFNIDGSTGVVTTAQDVDLSGGATRSARVTARDKGSPSLFSHAMVLLVVSPVNDHKPVFTAVTDQNMPENTQPGTLVYQVTATDSDVGSDGEIIYSLADPDVPFSVDAITGKLYTRLQLDREDQDAWDVVVVATDKSTSTPKSSSVTVHFDLEDENDNGPSCAPVPTLKLTQPYTPGPSALVTFTCLDRDINNNADLSFAITDGNTGGVFAVSIDGDLMLTLTPNMTSYLLVITVNDGGLSSLSTRIYVNIVVELELKFTNLLLTYLIEENMDIGQMVTKLDVCCSFETVLFQIVTGNAEGKFSIDELTGMITLIGSLDREVTPDYTLGITATTTDKSQNVYGETEVTVRDANDNTPTFSQSVYTFSIDHGSDPGTLAGVLTITDPDSEGNGNYDLTITSGNPDDTFELSGDSVVSKAAIDYNSRRLYSLVVLAEDHGVEARRSHTTVLISVNPDLSPPDFGTSSTTIQVDENTVTSSPIVDLDASASGAREIDLMYTITSGNINNPFTLDEVTGQVFISEELDYEVENQYTLVIEAKRRETLSSSVSLTLTVDISNLNDNSPVFTQSMYQFTVAELSPMDTTVGQVMVDDNDAGVYGSVTLALLPSDGSTDFALLPSGNLTVKVSPEHSRQNIYHLTVRAVDGGAPSRSTTSLVLVQVTDSNNNDPVFSAPTYALSVLEDTIVNTDLYAVKAADLDSGVNSKVSYHIIAGNDDGKFTLHSSTGVISVAGELDFETTASYQLEITATDGGSSPRSDQCVVDISVIDVNDKTPQFAVSSVSKTVNRFRATGVVVNTEIATDDEAGQNGEIVYSITSGNEDGIFLVGRTDGVVTIMSAPKADLYTLTVTASDSGIPPLNGSLEILVRVTPVIGSVVSNFAFDISENTQTGTTVGEVTPFHTHRPGAVVTYNIVSANFDSMFSVTKLGNGNAAIVLNNIPDRELYERYVLTVNELDDDGLSVDTIVKITITDENDNSPSFPVSPINIKVVEGTAVGYEVARVEAADPDEGLNGQITYDISTIHVDGFTMFRVDNAGVITVKTVPDFETLSSLSFDVTASDGGGNSGLVTVNVQIVDLPETEVILEAADTTVLITFQIPDTATSGTFVKTLTVADFGLRAADVTSVRFITLDSGVLGVSEMTGEVRVESSSGLTADAAFYQSLLLEAVETSSGDKLSILALLKTECFSASQYMIVFTFDLDRAYLVANRMGVRLHIQGFFNAYEHVIIWEIRQESTSNSRRRLLATQSSVHMFVLANSTSSSLNDVQSTTPLLAQDTALQTVQSASSGSPVSGLSTTTFPINQVMAYNGGTAADPEVFIASPVGMATIALVAAAVLVFIIALVFCIVYRWRSTNRKQKDISNESRGQKEKWIAPGPQYLQTPPAPFVSSSKPRIEKSPSKAPESELYHQGALRGKKKPKTLVTGGNTSAKLTTELQPRQDVSRKSGQQKPVKEDNISNTSRDTGYNEDGGSTPNIREVRHVGGKDSHGGGHGEDSSKSFSHNTKTEKVVYGVEDNTSSQTARGSPVQGPYTGHARNSVTSLDRKEAAANKPAGSARRGSLPLHNTGVTTKHGIHIGPVGMSGSLQDVDTKTQTSSGTEYPRTLGNNGHLYRPSGMAFKQHVLKVRKEKSSTIRQDVMSRDPCYYDWAKKVAVKGKRAVYSWRENEATPGQDISQDLSQDPTENQSYNRGDAVQTNLEQSGPSPHEESP